MYSPFASNRVFGHLLSRTNCAGLPVQKSVSPNYRMGGICFCILLLTLSFFLQSCGDSGSQQPTAKPVQVELDVYSGQPNPTWSLSSQDSLELARRLAGLPQLSQIPSEGDLGYRGFVVHNPGNVAGIGSQVRVRNGTITVTDKDGHRIAYQDTQGLEAWLEEQARAHGQADVLKSVGK